MCSLWIEDREVYLQILQEQAGKYGLEVLGYCLMTNHVHLVAIPHAEDSLAKGIGRTHFRYSQYINRFHKRSGHLWQGRFYSCALDERHLWVAMKYIELNPVRAQAVPAGVAVRVVQCGRPYGREGPIGAAEPAVVV